MKKRFLCILGLVAIVLLTFTTTHADILDPYDNIAAPPGTFALGTYLMYQHFPEFSPKDGDDIDIGVDATVLAFRPVYFSPVQFFGHSWGFNAILPMGQVSQTGLESSTGFGDLIFGPFIYLVENEANNFYLSFWNSFRRQRGNFPMTLTSISERIAGFLNRNLHWGGIPENSALMPT